MTNFFQEYLNEQLQRVDANSLRRRLAHLETAQGVEIRIDNKSYLNFSSNDYLGLAARSELKVAAVQAVNLYGAGSGSARLISGSNRLIHNLESSLATFKGVEASLCFSNGYNAALGAVTALVGEGDIVVIDKLVHACMVDAAKLSGAKLRVFKHNDLTDLERILQWADRGEGKTLILAESVYSMDGDIAPLRDIVELKNRYGAWLMVDEAHATGLYGKCRRGMAEEFGVGSQIDVQMGTLGKALGSAGGFVCGSQSLVDLLVNRARSFIFTTAPVPAQISAAIKALEMVGSGEGELLRAQLWSNVDRLKNGLIKLGWKLPTVRSAIVPIMVGDEAAAMALSDRLRNAGVWVPAVRYPTVAKGSARLRLTLSASHKPEHIEAFLETLGNA